MSAAGIKIADASRMIRDAPMDAYDFEVLKDDEPIVVMRSVLLRSSRAAWPRIAELAKKADASGCRIRVTNQSGEIVILVGVASARRYFDIGVTA